ncbi:MAG: DUF4870 domain-containing protein [Algisphaera sp.]
MSDSEASGGKPDTVMCVLSYFGIFGLIPLLTKKDDPFIQWQAKQGLILTVAAIALCIAIGVVASVTGLGVLGFVSMAVMLGYLALCIICIIKAIGGEKFEIPVISGFVGS